MGLLGPDAKLRAHDALGSRGDGDRSDRGSRSRLRAHRPSRRTGENAACRARHCDQRAHDRGARRSPGRKRYPDNGRRRCSSAGIRSCRCERAASGKTRSAATSHRRHDATKVAANSAATVFTGIAAAGAHAIH